MGLPVLVLLSFARMAPDVETAGATSAVHRIWDMPNPYALPPIRFSDPPLGPDLPPLPESAGARRWFVTEDSGDLMGLSLTASTVVGLQVEFVGPSELPQKTTRVTVDPNDPRFLLTTAGLRIQF